MVVSAEWYVVLFTWSATKFNRLIKRMRLWSISQSNYSRKIRLFNWSECKYYFFNEYIGKKGNLLSRNSLFNEVEMQSELE